MLVDCYRMQKIGSPKDVVHIILKSCWTHAICGYQLSNDLCGCGSVERDDPRICEKCKAALIMVELGE